MKKGNQMKLEKLSLLSQRALFLVLVLLGMGCATESTQTVVNFTELTFAEEFDVDGPPNPGKWILEQGRGPNEDGWGNNELQYYRPENATVSNGYLIITAKREQFEGASYTSARMTTKGKFEQQYGRFEARMRLPYGQGMWPAFWMLGADIDTNPWPGAGEIDIMENKGRTPSIISAALHGPPDVCVEPPSTEGPDAYNAYLNCLQNPRDGYFGDDPAFKEYDLVNERVDTEFHVYGVEWGPQYVNFYVDDVLFKQFTPEDEEIDGPWVFDKGPFYMLLNLAVGGNFDGPPNAETVFPQSMLVDYVRVYKYNGLD
ncbi:glycoside hydrolase family 16 protein [Lentiprolixibacter aurantiacus]|uniref:Glycoside hydrolase family 16 protein n=1 Tax=Lentiprolixibacter aurantiacus TaxID=2993939 RepID=A0AAE3MLW9_9FLAO|nr:glycoside hydrolase family 16 protein [Lentiprolixibacter aurantiacus]MCX2719833.1 glycoside hydrolase family 16 protein [Lentiprolixibacter aurantiacus]